MRAQRATNLVSWAADQRDMLPHLSKLTRLASEAQIIVELGTRGGVSTWAFLDGLPPDGALYSADIEECEVPPRVKEDPRWVFVQGDDMLASTRERLPASADLVFIDTSHEYEHTLAELYYAESLNTDVIACHDAEWPGVAQAMMEFCLNSNWRITAYYPASDDRGSFGLAILRPLP